MKKIITFLFLFLIVSTSIFGSDSSNVKIGTVLSPPFVIKNEKNEYEGICFDFFKEVAKKIDVKYKIVEYKDFEELVSAIEKKEVDISVTSLTITDERHKVVDFTQPYFISSLSIAIQNNNKNWLLSFFKNNLWELFQFIIMLIALLLIVGLFIWTFERKSNAEQFEPGVNGILNGAWWAAVTMTTVGYGDKAPKTKAGKAVAVIWMFSSLMLLGFFLAGLSSSFTVNRLEGSVSGINDLYDVRVGAVSRTTSSSFLNEKDIDHIKYVSIIEGLWALEKGKIDALVYDSPILKYYIAKEELENKVKLVPGDFNIQYYGFALNGNESLRKKINYHMLKGMKSDRWEEVLEKYNVD